MATPSVSLEALANLQADDIQKLIEILQCIAEARTRTTPTAPQTPHVPAVTTGEEEVILWEKVSTGNVPPQEVPPAIPSRTNIHS